MCIVDGADVLYNKFDTHSLSFLANISYNTSSGYNCIVATSDGSWKLSQCMSPNRVVCQSGYCFFYIVRLQDTLTAQSVKNIGGLNILPILSSSSFPSIPFFLSSLCLPNPAKDLLCLNSVTGPWCWIIDSYLPIRYTTFITARCTMHSAKRGLAIACRLSVRLSVCPSVTLVICDHIGWKSWKLIARTISPAPSLFVAKRRST